VIQFNQFREVIMIWLNLIFLFLPIFGTSLTEDEIDEQNVFDNDIVWTAQQAKELIESGK